MAITATDIHEQSFSIDKRGYDVDEVDMFLEHVADGIDYLNNRIAQLQDQLAEEQRNNMDRAYDVNREEDEARLAERDKRIADLERQLEARKADGNAIAQALIIAQRSADEITANANAKAHATVQEAEQEARKIIDRAENDKKAVIDATKKLENDREKARQDYKEFLSDLINDATGRLAEIGEMAPSSSSSISAHAVNSYPRKSISAYREEEPAPKQSFGHARPSYASQSTGTVTPAPAAPIPASYEKDLSGFGDAEDGFEFDEVE